MAAAALGSPHPPILLQQGGDSQRGTSVGSANPLENLLEKHTIRGSDGHSIASFNLNGFCEEFFGDTQLTLDHSDSLFTTDGGVDRWMQSFTTGFPQTAFQEAFEKLNEKAQGTLFYFLTLHNRADILLLLTPEQKFQGEFEAVAIISYTQTLISTFLNGDGSVHHYAGPGAVRYSLTERAKNALAHIDQDLTLSHKEREEKRADLKKICGSSVHEAIQCGNQVAHIQRALYHQVAQAQQQLEHAQQSTSNPADLQRLCQALEEANEAHKSFVEQEKAYVAAAQTFLKEERALAKKGEAQELKDRVYTRIVHNETLQEYEQSLIESERFADTAIGAIPFVGTLLHTGIAAREILNGIAYGSLEKFRAFRSVDQEDKAFHKELGSRYFEHILHGGMNLFNAAIDLTIIGGVIKRAFSHLIVHYRFGFRDEEFQPSENVINFGPGHRDKRKLNNETYPPGYGSISMQQEGLKEYAQSRRLQLAEYESQRTVVIERPAQNFG